MVRKGSPGHRGRASRSTATPSSMDLGRGPALSTPPAPPRPCRRLRLRTRERRAGRWAAATQSGSRSADQPAHPSSRRPRPSTSTLPSRRLRPRPLGESAAPSPSAGLLLACPEDAYQGDAQFTVSVDGQQVGGIYTTTAAHGAGATQQVAMGQLSSGPHQIGVSFINDEWGGTPATDRNLYVDGADLRRRRNSRAAARPCGRMAPRTSRRP